MSINFETQEDYENFIKDLYLLKHRLRYFDNNDYKKLKICDAFMLKYDLYHKSNYPAIYKDCEIDYQEYDNTANVTFTSCNYGYKSAQLTLYKVWTLQKDNGSLTKPAIKNINDDIFNFEYY